MKVELYTFTEDKRSGDKVWEQCAVEIKPEALGLSVFTKNLLK